MTAPDARPDAEPWTPPEDGTPWIAALGHSDHPPDRFFGLLLRHGVNVLVDVRSFPRSHVAHFDKTALAHACGERRIEYHHLGALGGLRDTPYETHMASPAWEKAYARLRELGLDALHRGGRAALLCVERDPADCHRRFIARRLEADGWHVLHILPDPAQARLF